jgi:ankyrin repeat protein
LQKIIKLNNEFEIVSQSKPKKYWAILLVIGRRGTPPMLDRSHVMFAVTSGNPDSLNLVLQSKSDISAKDRSGMSATDISVQNCKPNLSGKLLGAVHLLIVWPQLRMVCCAKG